MTLTMPMISTGRSIDYKCLMTLYELLLFIHIAATVVWVGAGLCSLVLATTTTATATRRRSVVSCTTRSASP